MRPSGPPLRGRDIHIKGVFWTLWYWRCRTSQLHWPVTSKARERPMGCKNLTGPGCQHPSCCQHYGLYPSDRPAPCRRSVLISIHPVRPSYFLHQRGVVNVARFQDRWAMRRPLQRGTSIRLSSTFFLCMPVNRKKHTSSLGAEEEENIVVPWNDSLLTAVYILPSKRYKGVIERIQRLTWHLRNKANKWSIR